MNKILTIIIPTYNMETLLSRCLDSFIVEEQYMNMMEILVVNDGSKDHSSEIGHQYENKYPNSIRVIDKVNGNYGSCINAGLKIAKGKYIRICDSDDCYENKNIIHYLKFLQNTDSDIVFSPYNRIDCNGNLLESFLCPDYYVNKSFLIDNLNWDNTLLQRFVVMHSIATKTEILKKNKYYQTEGISYTDSQFVFYSALYALSCSFCDKPIYNYYLGRDGQTVSTAVAIKSHMQLYQNANRMLKDYITINAPIPENRVKILSRPIVVCIAAFMSAVICHISKPKNKLQLLKELLKVAKVAPNKCNLENYLTQDRVFRLWRKWHIPAKILYWITLLKKQA